ncbi:MAG: efflux RND transporter periplasmic adaptor subunit [Planctomycetes bacterium]|nr:efflux RND transporter periplasmic adaptor subunit [Planctomycetota bacterium]
MSYEPIIMVGPRTMRRLFRGGRRSLMAIGTGALLLIVPLGFAFWPRGAGPSFAVRRADIVHSLVAVGRVETEHTIEIVPKITARIAHVHVQEGDLVETGQPLVSLQDDAIRAQFDEASRARDAARARWDEMSRGARAEDLDRGQAQVAEAEQEVKAAEARRAEMFRGARPEEVEEAEGRLAQAKADADFAETEYDRARTLAEKGVLSQRELDGAKRAREVAQAVLRQAKAHRDRVVKGASEEEKAHAEATVQAAAARLDQAKAAWRRLQAGATEEERRNGRAEADRAEAVVARLKFELEQTKILSPIRGVVVRRYREPSELAFPGMPEPVLVVAESGDRFFRVEVLETDVYKIRLDQPAVVTSDAYPGRRWAGKVARVAPAMGRKRLSSENPKEKTDVKVLEVRIVCDEKLELPLSLPVEARISEVVRKGVPVIPARAVDAAGLVRLPDGTSRRVGIGARDDAFVEVTSGLAEGERILLPE